MEDIKKNSETEIAEAEVKNETVESEAASSSQSETADNKKEKKAKKDKKPMPKKKKIIIITAASIVGVVVLSLFIWLMVMLFGPMKGQDLSSIPLKVDMGNDYYVGTATEVTDYSKIFPEGKDFNRDGDKLTFKQDNKTITKNIKKVDGAVNVYTFDELQANLKENKKVVIQNAYISVPKLEGTGKDEMPTLVVKNDVYGNGAVINVFELVASRNKVKDDKVTSVYLKGYGSEAGYTGVLLSPSESGEQIVFQDVHLTGNDMSNKEGGNLDGLSDSDKSSRGLLLFSKYGAVLEVKGNDTAKTKALVKHCVIENGHKVVHVRNAELDLEGTIIRNASDTALSIATYANEASTIKSTNNVIANSLTGAILFYSMYDCGINDKATAEKSWNKLIINGFLDIYNWKKQDGLSFLPETEGIYANLANLIVNSEITSKRYDKLKVEDNEGDKYIHFAIIKLKTGDGLPENGSTVEGYDKIGYSTAKENGNPNGFPIPDPAKGIVKDIDVWGYYGNDKGSVKPTDGFSEKMLETLYVELREGRK